MWIPVFFLLIVCRASLASLEEYLEAFEKCEEIVVRKNVSLGDIFELRIPDGDTFEMACPATVDYITCSADLARSAHELSMVEKEFFRDTYNYSIFVENLRRIIQEVCDKDSQLHKDYKANVECMYSSREIAESGLCMETAAILSGVKYIYRITPEMQCKHEAIAVACKAAQIHEQCGEKAFDAYLTLTRESSQFKYGVCDDEGFQEAKELFFSSSMEMSDAVKELYKVALDLKKKRK